MSLQIAKPEHEVAYQDLAALVNKHAASMTALEILAIAANMVGKIIAMQDQRVTSPEKALEVVKVNIEYGNQQVIEALEKSVDGASPQ